MVTQLIIFFRVLMELQPLSDSILTGNSLTIRCNCVRMRYGRGTARKLEIEITPRLKESQDRVIHELRLIRDLLKKALKKA